MAVPEAADAWPEEAADLAPTGRDRAAEHRQADSDVQLPGRAGDSCRNEEVEHGDSAAGSHHPGELPHRCRRVVDIAKEVRERQRVEGRVLERQVLGPSFLELDSFAEARSVDTRPARGQHLGALVESDDPAAVAVYELDGYRRGAAGNIEHGGARADLDPVDEEGAPARVLPEGEQPRVVVVGLAERREERLGCLVALADALGHGAIVAAVGLEEEIAAAAEAASAHAANGEELEGVVPAEPGAGARVYLCAYRIGEEQTWLALDSQYRPVADRALVREAVSIAAMCELAEESAGGGELGELRARLVELRLTDAPEGIEEAEVAAAELQETIRPTPRLASVGYLDAIGLAAARLEQTLGEIGGSPFAEAMKSGMPAADELAAEVIRSYKGPLG
jgi:hypothetical protein